MRSSCTLGGVQPACMRAVRGVQGRGGVPPQQAALLAHPDRAGASVLLSHGKRHSAGVHRPQPLANACKRDLKIPEIGYQTCNIKSGPAAFGRLYQLHLLSTSRTATVGTIGGTLLCLPPASLPPCLPPPLPPCLRSIQARSTAVLRGPPCTPLSTPPSRTNRRRAPS